MELRLCMVSGDRACLAPGPTQRRLMQLSERLDELHVVVPAPAHRQQLGPNVFVYGSGGSSRIAQWLATVRTTRRLIRRYGCNVVTAQDPFELGLAAYVASWGTGAKLHLQDHGAFLGNALFPTITVRRRMQYILGKWLVKRAARVRTVSERGRRGLLAAGVDERRVDVAPIPADVSRLLPFASTRSYAVNDPFKLVYVGRLEPEKGAAFLIGCLDPSWELTVVGSGSLEQRLRDRAVSCKANVTFVGQQMDVAPYLAAANVAVVPSLTEGWGLAAVEAAAAGLPVAMSDVGCAGELLMNGESALVVPPGDGGALHGILDRLANDEELRRSLGQAAARVAASLPSAEELLVANVASYQSCV